MCITWHLRTLSVPLIDLINITIDARDYMEEDIDDDALEQATKIFPYLAYVLTGRSYPKGEDLQFSTGIKARSSIYGFLFSNRIITWPRPNGRYVTTQRDGQLEPNYPYLHLLLQYDAGSFLSMLNEAFEDEYLSGGQDTNGTESFNAPLNRQRIVNVLLEVNAEKNLAIDARTYVNIFISRNLAKFSQFVLLPGSTLRQILVELCDPPSFGIKDECQLSAEYLLSVYHPTDMTAVVKIFEQAGFYRILRSIYKSGKQYARALDTFFHEDVIQLTVFDTIQDYLRARSTMNFKQVEGIQAVIIDHANVLASIDAPRLATELATLAPDLLSTVCNEIDSDSQPQYSFMKAIFEADVPDSSALAEFFDGCKERFVKLKCNYEPEQVADYISTLQSGNLHLDEILPVMESAGVIDAAVLLLSKDGLAKRAMKRLVKHLQNITNWSCWLAAYSRCCL